MPQLLQLERSGGEVWLLEPHRQGSGHFPALRVYKVYKICTKFPKGVLYSHLSGVNISQRCYNQLQVGLEKESQLQWEI